MTRPDEIGAAWGIKEQLRTLLTSGSLAQAHEHKMLLGLMVLAADMPETDRLWATICAWWDAKLRPPLPPSSDGPYSPVQQPSTRSSG